jgi:predicted ATPase
LLLVDNCERVLGGATELAALLASSPGLQVLATSRERLHIAGEREYPVEPLDEDAAAALFVERARSLRPSFAADETVAALCRRLDCLPLAVELAAARTNVLSAKQILGRLEDRFDLFTGGPRDAPARQQTLRAVLDWSYQLLNEEEQVLFMRVAVFASAFSLEAAETICGAGLDTLSALVEKSLVQHRRGRFVLLETIRAYATELFDQSGQGLDLRRKHAEYLASSCEGLKFSALVALVDAGPEDFRVCLAWALNAAPDLALSLAVAVSFYKLRTGPISGRAVAEGRRWIHEALEATPNEPSHARTFALGTASDLARGAGNAEDAKRFAESAVEAARLLDDPYLLGGALNGLAAAHDMLGAHDVAERIGEEALDAARASGDEVLIGSISGNLGIAAGARGDWDRALRLFGAHLAVAEGKLYENFVLLHVTLAELQVGHEPGAVAGRYVQIYQRASEDQQPYFMVSALHGLGLTAAKAGDASAAVRVLAAALSAYEKQGLVLDVSERIVQIVHEETVEALHRQLGADRFAAAWDEGSGLSPDEAATLALDCIQSAASARSLPPR